MFYVNFLWHVKNILETMQSVYIVVLIFLNKLDIYLKLAG